MYIYIEMCTSWKENWHWNEIDSSSRWPHSAECALISIRFLFSVCYYCVSSIVEFIEITIFEQKKNNSNEIRIASIYCYIPFFLQADEKRKYNNSNGENKNVSKQRCEWKRLKCNRCFVFFKFFYQSVSLSLSLSSFINMCKP